MNKGLARRVVLKDHFGGVASQNPLSLQLVFKCNLVKPSNGFEAF